MAEYGVKRIIAQDSHRNGVGGATAVVTLFEPEPYEDGEDLGVFVAISFPDRERGPLDEYSIKRHGGIREALVARDIESFRAHTYAVSLTETAAENIGFAQGNSWRAADHWGPDIAKAWREQCLSEDFPYDPFDQEQYIEQYADGENGKSVAQMTIEKIEEDLDILIEERRSLDKYIAATERRLEAERVRSGDFSGVDA